MSTEEIIRYYNNSRFVEHCGIKLTARADDRIEGCIEVMPMHLNGSGHLHGGLLFTLADTVGGANSRRYADHITTLDSDFHFLTSNTTRFLYGNAELIRNGGKVLVLRIKITDDTSEVFAEGTFTYYKL